MTVVVDTHVHLYPCFDPAALLGHAMHNLGRALGGQAGDRAIAVAATPRMDGYALYEAAAAAGKPVGEWRLAPAGDGRALIGTRRPRERLLLVPAAQIDSAEGLEVLIVGRSRCPWEGWPVAEIAAAALAAGVAVSIPWGFGKWTGRRGRVLAGLLADGRGPVLALADSGGRPRGPLPRALRRARRAGLGLLSGSDPLPLPGQEARAGSAGVRMPGCLPAGAPGAGLIAMLRRPPPGSAPFRSPRPILRFVVDQVRLRLGAPHET